MQHTCKGMIPNRKSPTPHLKREVYQGFELLAGWPGPHKDDQCPPVVTGETLYIDMLSGDVYRIADMEEFHQYLSDYTGVGHKTNLVKVKVEEVLPEHIVKPVMVS